LPARAVLPDAGHMTWLGVPWLGAPGEFLSTLRGYLRGPDMPAAAQAGLGVAR
jgi:hypothetical protein